MLKAGAWIDGDSSADRLPSFGVSAKTGYIGDDVIVSGAADFAFSLLSAKELQMNFDAGASIYAGFFGADVFYATKSKDYDLNASVLHLLSARLRHRILMD